LTGAGTHVGAGFGTTTAPHLRSILLEPRVAGIDGPNRLIVDERHAQRVLHVHRVLRVVRTVFEIALKVVRGAVIEHGDVRVVAGTRGIETVR